MEDGIYRAKYIGKTTNMLNNGDIYKISVENGKYTYNFEILQNLTKKVSVEITVNYSSQISIYNNWKDVIKDDLLG